MTQEQKAQRYDEALAKARTIVNSINVGLIGKDSFEAVFPELKEDDERIRKELIDYLKERKSCESYGQYIVRYDRWIDWLEKQGEQKLTDNSTTKRFYEQKDIDKLLLY